MMILMLNGFDIREDSIRILWTTVKRVSMLKLGFNGLEFQHELVLNPLKQ